MKKWLEIAHSYVGKKEVAGLGNNPTISKWWREIDSSFTDDSVPWCAAFVGACLVEAGLPSTRSAAARSYEHYGVELEGPAVGCIVVFWRGTPESKLGHVGFVVGRDDDENLMVLGGNQGDQVCVKAFDVARVVGYRWPAHASLPDEFRIEQLPFQVATDKASGLSTNEA